MSLPTAFVCGVTGTQGGSTARYLRAQGAQVHAVARDPTSEKAEAIKAIGVKLWPGDYDNQEALKSAINGCDSVFLNLMPSFQDGEEELRHAKSIIDIARDAGVKHFVYSSGFCVQNPETLPYWNPKSLFARFMLSKQAIEKLVRGAGFSYWTILRPGNFMTNYLKPFVAYYPGLADKGEWATAMQAQSVLPMVDTETIGAFGGSAILNPQKFNKQEIEYADELITLEEVIAKLSRATGRDLKAIYMSDEDAIARKDTDPFIGGQLAMRNMAQAVDMENVKSWGIPLGTFDKFLEREKKQVTETYNNSV